MSKSLSILASIALLGSLSNADEVAKTKLILSNKTFAINGSFVKYGPDAFDWVYVTSDSDFVGKLEGLNEETGYFDWKIIHTKENPAFNDIYFYENKIIFGSVRPEYTEYRDIALNFDRSMQYIDGYFLQFNAGAFDWVYTTSYTNCVNKLNGLDGDKTYISWSPLQTNKEGFSFINIDKFSHKITFGAGLNIDTSNATECSAFGGKWIANVNTCYVEENKELATNSSVTNLSKIDLSRAWCTSNSGEWIEELNYCKTTSSLVTNKDVDSVQTLKEQCESHDGFWITVEETNLCI